MFKKIIALGVTVIMIFSFSACGSNYEYKEGDFSLVIKADKAEARGGDVVYVTAALKNLSGRNIRIKMSHTDYKKLNDMILITLFQENTYNGFLVSSKGGPRRKLTIKKGAVITRTMEFLVEESDCEAASLTVFYTGKGFKKSVAIYSESLKIIVKE